MKLFIINKIYYYSAVATFESDYNKDGVQSSRSSAACSLGM